MQRLSKGSSRPGGWCRHAATVLCKLGCRLPACLDISKVKGCCRSETGLCRRARHLRRLASSLSVARDADFTCFCNPETSKCNECACLHHNFPTHLCPARGAMDNAAAETSSGEKQQSAPDTPAIAESQASDVVPTTKLQFFAILVALVFSIFTVALDGTIIVTAIPRITDDYQALSDVGWYGSAFTLPSAALVPLFGKLYALFSAKWTFLAALFVVEIGSLVSAVAPSSVVFIVGRAISGAGSAGIFNGALVTISIITPLAKRPAYQSIIGAVYAVATITAPLIGGAFTDYVSWRCKPKWNIV